MTSFTHYRTKLLSQSAAARFAGCLRRNPRFAYISVERSSQAKGEACWFVRFEPSAEGRRQQLVDAQDNARAKRGCEGEFTFLWDGTQSAYLCFSHGSGAVYTVTEGGCDCPDSVHRLTGTSICCKHRWALKNAAPVELGPAPVPSSFDAARFEAIFG